MENLKSYRQQLRSIGQSLEAQRITVFEMSCRGDQFVVKGEPEKETSMLAALRQWQQRRRSEGLNGSLTFTSQDIDQLERQGRAHRTQPNRLPDFYGLANTLRTVGYYLELKRRRVVGVAKETTQPNVTLAQQRRSPGDGRTQHRIVL